MRLGSEYVRRCWFKQSFAQNWLMLLTQS